MYYYSNIVCRKLFDVTYPFLLKVPKLLCVTHSVNFTLLNYVSLSEHPEEFISMLDNIPTPLVIGKRKLFTLELYEYILDEFKELYSFEAISNLLERHWERNFKRHIQMVRSGCRIPLSSS